MPLRSINPHNNKLLKEYKEDSPKQVEAKLKAAQKGFLEWKESSFSQHSQLVKQLGKQLLKQKEELAELMALEIGKPLKQGIAEIEKCAFNCEYYAQNGIAMLADELVETSYSKSFISYQPLGVVLALMPWNYPFWQVFRCIAPTLMAGNTLLLKHANNTSGCAKAILKIFEAVDAPKGVFDVLMIDIPVIESVIQHPAVAAVSLTGSTKAGKAVATQAGAVLKKCVLELGGSDAYIILKDADIELAAKECVESRLKNGGQSCIAAKRFIVDQKIADQFTEAFIENMKTAMVGNPMDAATTMGPLARADLKETLHEQVSRSQMKGARVAWGGSVSELNGAYFPPLVLTDVQPGMPAFDEELFGPVAAIIAAKDEKEAIQLANQSIYGLGGAVFTANQKKGEKIASQMIDAGSVFVNVQVNSDPKLPFGGIKESGFGRELGLHGIREFTNIKTVAVK